MQIKHAGRFYNLERRNIENVLKSAEPENGQRFFIASGGKKYPLKQVFSLATGVPTMAFPTNQAFSVLSRLGFAIIDERRKE